MERALVPAVRAVAAGFSVVPAALRNGGDSLIFSHREREVLRLAVSGHTNGEIATGLFLAESTVKSPLSSAYLLAPGASESRGRGDLVCELSEARGPCGPDSELV